MARHFGPTGRAYDPSESGAGHPGVVNNLWVTLSSGRVRNGQSAMDVIGWRDLPQLRISAHEP